jgi:hypothetical protein
MFQAIIYVDRTYVCLMQEDNWIPPSWVLCLESVSHLLVMVSSSSNFIIYCTISTQFKVFIRKKFMFRPDEHIGEQHALGVR